MTINLDDRGFVQRVAAVNPLLAPDPQGRSLRQRLAERPGGKSPATLKRYLQRIKTGKTVLALQKQPRKDKGKLVAFSPELLLEAIRLREEEPRRITRIILDHLKANPDFAALAATVSINTLGRHLRQRGKTRRALKKATKGYRRFERPYPGSLWQFDYTDGLYLEDPQQPGKRRKTLISVGVDDHSRLCLDARAYWRGNWPSLEDTTRHAFATWSLPVQIFVDNGKVYHANEYQRILSELNVGHIYRTPHRPKGPKGGPRVRSPFGLLYPEGGGKIEAIIGTLQEELFPELGRAGITTLDELNAILAEWAYRYNRRVHTETGMTPLDRWQANITHLRPIDPVRLAEAFWWVKTPRVTKTGLVSVNGCEYELDLALVGQTITARYDPFDASGTILVVDAYGKLWGAYQPRPHFPADNGRGKGVGDRGEHLPLTTARTYVDRLAATGRGRAAPLPTHPSDATAPELAIAHKLLHLVGSYLLRPELTPGERQAVVACVRDLVVIRFDVAEIALRRLVHRAGRTLHIERYTAAIIESHRLEARS